MTTPLFTKWLLKNAFVAVTILLFNGCGSETGLQYTPQTNVMPVSEASHVSVQVLVTDERLVHWLRQEADGDPGDEMAASSTMIYDATNDVEIVSSALKSELVQRGFNLDGRDATVLVGLNTFYTYRNGKITISVLVKKPDETILYSERITGQGPKSDSRKSDKTVAEDALQDCMMKLFADPAFMRALLNTSPH